MIFKKKQNRIAAENLKEGGISKKVFREKQNRRLSKEVAQG